MGYFAGSGSGKGWNSINFVLTPTEFQEIFQGLTYSFLNTSSRVDSDYKESSKEDVFQAYKIFFEQILIGDKILSRQDVWKIEKPIRESIIDNISNTSYREIKDDKGNLLSYRIMEPQVPVINLSPFYLLFSAERDLLSAAYLNEEGIIGLQLSFPQYITWHDKEDPETIETNTFKTHFLYETLV